MGEWIWAHPGKKYRVHRYDLDGFKNINGTFGYDAGNKLLIDFGHYMHNSDTEDSFSAHLNADHFVRFSAENKPSPLECYDRFLAYFENYELNYPLSLHIGVYDLCEPDCDPYSMSYRALLALQSTKGDLSQHIAYYHPSLLHDAQEQMELLGDVGTALRDGQFKVWFQPQVDYESNAITGAEALVRWQHSKKGLLSPAVSLPLFERSKLITSVDKYVWEETCRQLKKWLDMGFRVPISINISRIDIYDTDLCAHLTGLVRQYGIPPELLRLEITESFYIDRPAQVSAVVDSFRAAGFTVEIDDFGAGHSSLNILKDLNIDILKLDMTFLTGLDSGSSKGWIVLRSVIQMAAALQMAVIAEGVETQQQASQLHEIGYNCMQGYYYSSPLPAEDFEVRLRSGLKF